jgi:[ribosomal protein S18]-alanine N-acetyltransferase
VHSTARDTRSQPARTSSLATGMRLILPDDPNRPATLTRPASSRLRIADISAAVDAAFRAGISEVRTQAMFAADTSVFEKAGGVVRSALVLLERPIGHTEGRPAHRWPHRLLSLDAVACLDGRAFDAEWRFDRALLRDAVDATRHHRLVGFGPIGRPHAYCLSGRAGRHGYIQRLAVSPERAGLGLGGHLVTDALAWFARRGVAVAQVNTEPHNHRALALYERHGFQMLPSPIYIMSFEKQ